MCLCVLCFSTCCFLLGSFVYGHGTSKAIFAVMFYTWLTLHQAIQSSSIYSYPKLDLLLTLNLFIHQFSCSFPVFVVLFHFCLVGIFLPQVLKNSLWKHYMKRWWLRSYSRSGHVWLSNSYPAGLSWKICTECSIFQWVCPVPVLRDSWSLSLSLALVVRVRKQKRHSVDELHPSGC